MLCKELIRRLFLLLLSGLPILAVAQGRTTPDSLAARSSFAGPSSVEGQISADQRVETRLMKEYFDFQNQLAAKRGLSIGLDYFSMFQMASSSLGEKQAFSGVWRFYGSWGLVGKNTGNKGSLIFKVENRHRYGNMLAAQDLGFETGYAGLTALTFSNIHWGLTNLYWQQSLLEGRLAFVAGLVDATDYLNVYGLVNPWADFSNLAFSTGATIPVPNQGLGTAFRVLLSKSFYVLAGIADANGDPTDPLGSFQSISQGELFTHVEAGWIGGFDKRYSDNVHLSFWHAGKREEAGIASGWGLAFSASQEVGVGWNPFAGVAYGKEGGALWSASADLGLGYRFPRSHHQLSLAFNWGRPSESTLGPDLRDQYTAEIYFSWQPLKILILTPDLQLLIHPALYPSKAAILMFGIRGRIVI